MEDFDTKWFVRDNSALRFATRWRPKKTVMKNGPGFKLAIQAIRVITPRASGTQDRDSSLAGVIIRANPQELYAI